MSDRFAAMNSRGGGTQPAPPLPFDSRYAERLLMRRCHALLDRSTHFECLKARSFIRRAADVQTDGAYSRAIRMSTSAGWANAWNPARFASPHT